MVKAVRPSNAEGQHRELRRKLIFGIAVELQVSVQPPLLSLKAKSNNYNNNDNDNNNNRISTGPKRVLIYYYNLPGTRSDSASLNSIMTVPVRFSPSANGNVNRRKRGVPCQ